MTETIYEVYEGGRKLATFSVENDALVFAALETGRTVWEVRYRELPVVMTVTRTDGDYE